MARPLHGLDDHVKGQSISTYVLNTLLSNKVHFFIIFTDVVRNKLRIVN